MFIQTYPADLQEGAKRIGALLARPEMLCVDMGHTHYDELANNCSTVFMATCSTMQVEEKPPDFLVNAIDGRTVSWRFKALDDVRPFVLVTQPADRRLVTDAGPRVDGAITVGAQVLDDQPVTSMEVQMDNDPWQPMAPSRDGKPLWQSMCAAPGGTVRVRARDAAGRTHTDAVQPVRPGWRPPPRKADGSDSDCVGPWPERGILNTQLGPNRNGRKW